MLLWRDQTCPAHALLITSWKAVKVLLLLLLLVCTSTKSGLAMHVKTYSYT